MALREKLKPSPRVGDEVVLHQGTHMDKARTIKAPIYGVLSYLPSTDRWLVTVSVHNNDYQVCIKATEVQSPLGLSTDHQEWTISVDPVELAR